jgi:hypothetical protein
MDGRKVHNEKLLNLWSLPNISIRLKSRVMKLAGNVACTGEMRNA